MKNKKPDICRRKSFIINGSKNQIVIQICILSSMLCTSLSEYGTENITGKDVFAFVMEKEEGFAFVNDFKLRLLSACKSQRS